MKKHIVCLAVSLLLVTSCGKSPQKARQELTKIGIEFTNEAFEKAVMRKDKIAIDLFLESEHDASGTLTAAIINYTTGEDKDISLIKELIDNSSSVDVTQLYGTPLEKAVSFENEELIKLLLKKGADPNHNDGQPLREALLDRKNMKIAKLLVDNGADINIKSKAGSLLKRSIVLNEFVKEKGTSKITKYILNSGAIVNDGEDGNSDSLIQAVYNQDKELIEDLLERGANVNSTWQNPNNYTSFVFGRRAKTHTLYDIVQDKSELIAILDKYSKQQKQAKK